MAADSFAADALADAAALEALAQEGGSVIDTAGIDVTVTFLKNQAAALEAWAYGCTDDAGEAAGASALRAREARLEQIRILEARRDAALVYSADGSAYSRSCPLCASLARAAGSLCAVTFNEASGRFDISAAGDLSWWSEEMEGAYCVMRNARILKRYLPMGEDGLVEPTVLMYALMGKLALLAGGALGSLGSIWDCLNFEERYVLLWFVAHASDDVYGLERAAASPFRTPIGSLLAGAFYAILSGNGLGVPAPITGILAFEGSGSGLTSSDGQSSIQYGAGFMDFYDPAVQMLGMRLESRVVTFMSGGFEYRYQMWFGSYAAGTLYGAEGAFYSRPGQEALVRPHIGGLPLDSEGIRAMLPGMTSAQVDSYFINYAALPEGRQFPMRLELSGLAGSEQNYNDTGKYAENGDHWWNLRMEHNSQGYEREDVRGEVCVTIADSEFRSDFLAALDRDGVSYSEDKSDVIVHFGD
jgi:hypothetical protein